MEKNITGEKMLSHIDRIVGEKKPITADIFLTNYCNNRCPYCTYGRWELDTGARAMRYEDFITYAKRLAAMGVQGFILTGGGEPTINPDFEKIADAYGLDYFHLEHNDEMEQRIDEFLACEHAAMMVCEVYSFDLVKE